MSEKAEYLGHYLNQESDDANDWMARIRCPCGEIIPVPYLLKPTIKDQGIQCPRCNRMIIPGSLDVRTNSIPSLELTLASAVSDRACQITNALQIENKKLEAKVNRAIEMIEMYSGRSKSKIAELLEEKSDTDQS